ncbi:MAG: ydaF 2 [Burkholderiales bacterium]|jgi:RimJ/RimL family protein N-acetyltransferase|nr:ydaF 2 [Burkholderiales bacterium]
MIYYETERLIIRQWQQSDIAPFVLLNQDKAVMQFLIPLNEQQTITLVNKFIQHFKQFGYTIYACELKSNRQFIGFIGLWHRFDMPFSPCVEIGWRLFRKHWGQGLATEAAKKCLEIGFLEFNLDEIVSFCAKINIKSERVMQKINMVYCEGDDFYHYKLARNNPLSLHILYRIKKTAWIETTLHGRINSENFNLAQI